MDSLFNTIGGLPVHPLVIHFVVVLVPLAAAGLIVAVLNLNFRRRFAFALLCLLAASVPLAFVAKESGEALSERIGITERHEDLGDSFPLWVAALTVVAGVWLLIARRGGMNTVRKIIGLVLVAASAGVIGLTFLVGHSGAEATWSSLTGSTTVTEPDPEALTAEVVSQHATADDCWTIIDGNVYDMTSFLARHPGGSAAITALCGGDGTSEFGGQHGSASAPNAQLESLKIGVLATP
jgi:uncharacterized membrane protein